ncbi:sugar-transfer associated ATP-grasp domain-containing protein [Tamlana sp. 2201CG12-4]|uniref:sugar-transfer associated ATP-grasp domain-containing protein n=1 Tax=Tamlana sp. 2201CG12-4 TaxID=3112582 RepID=UPI002DBE6ADF|nr:sugar-transfer associated ATP-grasp domain-containing protein [Tamlana sp. 2201CG12-4]MEC3908855.1 sugar-transfer associated ATP-grasp domain-containing protein [Tamlana sp. 2201CG12-4]
MVATFKSFIYKSFVYLKGKAYVYKLTYQYRKVIKQRLRNKLQVLSRVQNKEIKAFYNSYGYKNVKTWWHEFYYSNNHMFSVKYVPEDLFHAVISKKFNQMRQWPSLLDKNLLGLMFRDFKQPYPILKNINGFYYIDGKIVSEEEAINRIVNEGDRMVIKPTIDSGNGQGVISVSFDNDIAVKNLFRTYKKDFIVQKIVIQHETLQELNFSSLNTIRAISYLNEKGVHVLSSVIRIGNSGSFTDNFEDGGMACGINENGMLKKVGYLFNGVSKTKTNTGIILGDIRIPSYNKIVEQVKDMHTLIPYFRLVSWDIGIDIKGKPVLIEYNTYHQNITMHQLVNGPLFGDFTEEILKA